MRPKAIVLAAALVGGGVFSATSCASGELGTGDSTDEISNGDGGAKDDAPSVSVPACVSCDSDGDGVTDATDKCAGTPAGAKVNTVGCADSQVSAKLEPNFPPLGLTWTPTGNL